MGQTRQAPWSAVLGVAGMLAACSSTGPDPAANEIQGIWSLRAAFTAANWYNGPRCNLDGTLQVARQDVSGAISGSLGWLTGCDQPVDFFAASDTLSFKGRVELDSLVVSPAGPGLYKCTFRGLAVGSPRTSLGGTVQCVNFLFPLRWFDGTWTATR